MTAPVTRFTALAFLLLGRALHASAVHSEACRARPTAPDLVLASAKRRGWIGCAVVRLLLVRILLGLLLLVGLAATTLCVRSFAVGDNASWHARTVQPAASADAALRGSSPAEADWVTTTDWIWTSDEGIAELGRLRVDMFTPEADFSGWHYGPGFNYWRLNAMGAPYTWDPPLTTGGGTIGLHYCCVYWFDTVRPTITTNAGGPAGPWRS